MRMLELSLCVNPRLSKHVTVRHVGVADQPKTCFVVSSEIDVSNGELRCNLPEREGDRIKQLAETEPGYEVRSVVQVVTLDSLLGSTNHFMAKLDVSGLNATHACHRGRAGTDHPTQL